MLGLVDAVCIFFLSLFAFIGHFLVFAVGVFIILINQSDIYSFLRQKTVHYGIRTRS